MAKWTYNIPVIGSDGKVETLRGEVSAPDDSLSTQRKVRDVLGDRAERMGYEVVEVGLYNKR